jgi:hypothetical protein
LPRHSICPSPPCVIGSNTGARQTPQPAHYCWQSNVTPKSCGDCLRRQQRSLGGLVELPSAASKLVPRGVICLESALASHELTRTAPRRVCIAVGVREWEPRIAQPPVEIVRFGPQMLKAGTRTHLIAGVSVNIYKPAKTVADLFHYALRQGRDGPKADVSRALQAMKEGLRLGKATPAEIARYADQAGIWSKVQPYLEAMTVEG